MTKEENEKFEAYLKWAREEVAKWPEWKRNLLGLHYSDKKRLGVKNEEDGYDFRSRGW